MIIQQVSVFLENKAGSAVEVTNILATEGINIATFSLSDGSEFGLLHMVLSDTEKGIKALKAAGKTVFVNNVVSVTCPNETGSLTNIFKTLTEKGVSVEYMYSYHDGANAKAILRTKDVELCNTIIESLYKI